MQNAAAVAKEAHPQEPEKCPPKPGQHYLHPNNEQHHWRTPSQRAKAWTSSKQPWAHTPRTKCSAKAKGARQKARARTESGCWPASITSELCGCPSWYENNRDPYVYKHLTAEVLGGTNRVAQKLGYLQLCQMRQSHLRASTPFWHFTYYSL